MSTDGPQQGAEVNKDGVGYRIWAPRVSQLAVDILYSGGKTRRSMALEPCGGGYFQGTDPLGKAGDLYKYRLDGERLLPDPASRWQPEGVHGPSMVIDPKQFRWSDQAWKRPAFRDLVLYELHIGTFTQTGTFLSAIERLQHIRDLGTTAIEIMPVGEFAGDRNWGYDGTYLSAPSRVYGHPDQLRALVNAAHKVGLAVILDVVYNHFGPDGNYLAAYIGEYLDESTKTPWGGAIQYGHPAFKGLRDCVISNPGYWMREFHIDGFRLDATHAITDPSSRHILQELTASIHECDGYAIAEDSRNEALVTTPECDGGLGFDGVWADDFHHVVRVAHTGDQDGYLGDFQGSHSEALDTLRHGWLYRGRHSASAGRNRGTPCRHLRPACFIHCTSNHDQTGNHAFGKRLAHRIRPAALRASEMLLCLSPYTPMLFMGQEWAASSPFHFFTDHHPELGKLIIEGRHMEFSSFAEFRDGDLASLPNPQSAKSFLASKLLWKESQAGYHAQMLELFRSALALRREERAFRPADRFSWCVFEAAPGVGCVLLGGSRDDWMVVFDLEGGHQGSLQDAAGAGQGSSGWQVVLSSNAERFGGSGCCAVNPATLDFSFVEPETLILRRGRDPAEA